MSQIGPKNTKPEILLRKALWSLGFRYRLHYKLPGKPDIVFIGPKVAIFVDGCFWHGCPEHYNRPKTNRKFWDLKIGANIDRDLRNKELLKAEGWKVLRFWEHEVQRYLPKVINKIRKALGD